MPQIHIGKARVGQPEVKKKKKKKFEALRDQVAQVEQGYQEEQDKHGFCGGWLICNNLYLWRGFL